MDNRIELKKSVALTIAGSDPSSGAGIQADLETFQACGVHGVSVTALVTSQTSNKFNTFYVLPKKIISSQFSILFDAYTIHAAKTGLLYKKSLIDLLIKRFKKKTQTKLIVDPVMKATLGKILLQPQALPSLKRLIHEAYLVTPNLYEAGVLANFPVRNLEEMKRALLEIHKLGARYVLIKGGHLNGEPMDLFYDGKNIHEFSKKRVKGEKFHGLGCRFSAALTAFTAQDLPVLEAVRKAENYMDLIIPTLI